jgi:hypothetical protein
MIAVSQFLWSPLKNTDAELGHEQTSKQGDWIPRKMFCMNIQHDIVFVAIDMC